VIDKHSTRNILLMHKSVEKALDQMRLMILPEEDGEYQVGRQSKCWLGC